jgi:hypothetical protein
MLARISIIIKSAKQKAHSKFGVLTLVTARIQHQVIQYKVIRTSENCTASMFKAKGKENKRRHLNYAADEGTTFNIYVATNESG